MNSFVVLGRCRVSSLRRWGGRSLRGAFVLWLRDGTGRSGFVLVRLLVRVLRFYGCHFVGLGFLSWRVRVLDL